MEINFEKAEIAFSKKDYFEAIEQSILTFGTYKNIESIILLMKSYYNLQIYKKVIIKAELSEGIVKNEQQDIQLIRLKANSFTRLGLYEQAINEYNYLLQKYPDSKLAQFSGTVGKGAVYSFHLKEIELEETPVESKQVIQKDLAAKALECYSQANQYIKTKKEKGLLLNNIACIHQINGEDLVASKYFEKALDLSEGFLKAEILTGLGLSLSRLGDVEQGLKLVAEARKIYLVEKHQEGLGRNIKTVGIIEKERGNLNEASSHFSQALKIFADKELFHQAAEVSMYLADIAQTDDKKVQYLADYYIYYKKKEESRLCVGFLE